MHREPCVYVNLILLKYFFLKQVFLTLKFFLNDPVDAQISVTQTNAYILAYISSKVGHHTIRDKSITFNKILSGGLEA